MKMKPSHRKHIKEHLGDLIRLTTVNVMILAELLQQGTFEDTDVQKVNAEKTDLDKSKVLYELLVTRINGYLAILKALVNARQSGAYEILFSVSCEIISNLKVGTTSVVKGFLSSDQIAGIANWLNENVSIDERLKRHETLFKLEEKTTLCRDTIPQPYFFYFSRSLSRRVAVDSKLFTEDCSDVFVFKNIESRQKLREFGISKNCESSSYLVVRKKITSRFILLDIESDWEIICGIIAKQKKVESCESQTPVHLFMYETESFLLEKTTFASSVLRRHIKNETKPECCSENQFVDKIAEQNTKGYCICDLPGMGKTLLLASLARKVYKKYPQNIVAYISLRNFPKEFPTGPITSDAAILTILNYITTSQLSSRVLYELVKARKIKFELFFDALDEVKEEKLKQATELLSEICKNMPGTRIYVTSRPVVRTMLENVLGVIAYDIVPFAEETQLEYLTKYWLAKDASCSKERLNDYGKTCLKNFKCSLKEEERDIAGIPLQCGLIAKVHWEQATAFANETRKNLPDLTHSFESSLSEIYAKYMKRQFGEAKCKFNCIQNYFHSGGKRCSDTACQVKSFHIWKSIKLIFPNIFKRWFEKQTGLFEDLSTQNKLSPGLLKLCENNNENNEDLEFVHLTFPEYLAAEYFSKALFIKPESQEQQQTFQEFVFDSIFTWANQKKIIKWNVWAHKLFEDVVAYFLNALLAEKENKNMYVLCKTVLKLPVLEGCMHQNFETLLGLYFKAVKNRRKSQECINEDDKAKHMRDYDLDNILRIATTTLNAENVEKVCEFFKENFGIYLLQLDYSRSGTAPTYCAIRRGDMEMTEYLAERLSRKRLIYWCVKRTYFENLDLVDKKLAIADMLLEKYPDLLTNKSDEFGDEGNPFFAKEMHLKAIKFLYKNVLNFQEANRPGKNMLYSAAKYMSTPDFFELCNVLKIEYKVLDYYLEPKTLNDLFRFPEDTENKTKVLVKVLLYLRSTTSKETQEEIALSNHNNLSLNEIFTTFLNADFYQTHSEIFTILFNAAVSEKFIKLAEILLPYDPSLVTKTVKWYYEQLPILFIVDDMKIFKFLVDSGGNVFDVDKKGRTLIHFIAQWGEPNMLKDVLKYIGELWNNSETDKSAIAHSFAPTEVKKPTSFEELFDWPTTESKETPLHIIMKCCNCHYSLHIQILNLLIAGGRSSETHKVTNVNAIDKDGNTALHIAVLYGCHLEVIKCLVESGIDVKIKNKDGRDVADICKQERLSKQLEYFETLNIKDS